MSPGDGDLTPGALLRRLREHHDFEFQKGLSQHFLVDPVVIERIVRTLAPAPGELVVEIGAGAGFLTRALLSTGARVVAVELDAGMIPLLEEATGGAANLRILNEDILRVSLPDLLGEEGATRCAIAGNLPYHITTPALFRLFPDRALISRMVVMVQREVGVRMAAGPGTKEYGALSVAVAWSARCERIFEVAPGAFVPRPKIRSAVVRLLPVERTDGPDFERKLFAVVRASFGQRRKMLVNALEPLVGSREEANRMLGEAGIAGSRRGETLGLAEFMTLARLLPPGASGGVKG